MASIRDAQILKFLPNSASVLHLGKKYFSGPLFQHEWTIYDLQYVFLFSLGIFIFYIIERPGVIFKLLIVGLFTVGLYFPRSRGFFLSFLPVASWGILFYSCQFIPAGRRPHIYVSVLPALENILYGDNLSAIIAKHTNVVKDVLAWFPYGVIHFTLPFITSIGLWWFGPPGLLPVFSRSFGYMNIAGVLTQLVFPCSPPWYEYTYGMNIPASYNMRGDPGGLARIDDLFGSKAYTEAFGGSPMVFGAFPSLHSACAIIQTLFISYLMPKSRLICVIYVLWIWWACMYLTHHYMVDLVGGGIYAIVAFWSAWKWLPDINHSYANRWVYFKNPLLPRNMGDISTDNFTVIPTPRDRSLDMAVDDQTRFGSKQGVDVMGVSDAADTTTTTLLYETNDEFDLGDGDLHRNEESNNSTSSIF